MTEEKCQHCGRANLIYFSGKCRIQNLDNLHYTELIYCASCGQLQGEFPMVSVFREILENKVNELNETLLSLYRQGLHAKLELEYPGNPDDPERYGRLFLRLREVEASERRFVKYG